MHIFLGIVTFAAGFGACWLTRDTIARAATGTEAFVKSLESKIAALRATL